MGLTSTAQVRQHLNRVNAGDGEVRNWPVRLISDGYIYLPHSQMKAESETVKAIENDVPVVEIITLESSSVSFSQSALVSGSVVCSANSSLSQIFQENADFSVDYFQGTITRIEGGAIVSGSSVTVWYQYYRVYQRGIDYQIDYDRGRVKRLAGGAIEDNQEVLIDYGLGGTHFPDEEIEQAIVEAESEIALLIHPQYRESADPALQTAATALTLSILFRDAAGMTNSGTARPDQLSRSWMELSESYRNTARRLLVWFGRQAPQLKAPRLG